MPVRKLLIVALLPVALSACSAGAPQADPAPSNSAPSNTASVAPGSSAVAPAAPVEQTQCGDVVLIQGAEVPPEATACFLDAVREHRPAVLTVTRPTVEGDPIRYAYEALPDGRVEVITDTRQDNFGNKGMFREVCTGPTAGGAALMFATCSSRVQIG